MKRDKLREKYEKEFFSEEGRSKNNPNDVEDFEQKFAEYKEKHLKKKNPLMVPLIVSSLLLTASGIVCGTRIANKLNFEEPVYSQESARSPDYFNKNPIGITFDGEDFSEKQLEIIDNVLHNIDEKCPGLRFVYDDDNWNIRFYVTDVNKDRGLDSFVLATATNNLIKSLYSGIAVDENFAKTANEQEFERVITHEILHSLGLQHTKDFTNIMFPMGTHGVISDKEFEILNMLYPTEQTQIDDEAYTFEGSAYATSLEKNLEKQKK